MKDVVKLHRQIPVVAEPDVLLLGAGAAGFGNACAAVQVLLLDLTDEQRS